MKTNFKHLSFALSILAISATMAFSGFKAPAKVNAAIADKTLASTYVDSKISVLGDFSINAYVNSKADLEAYCEEYAARPANIIMYVDSDNNITDKDGKSLGMTVQSAFEDYIGDDMIPCFYIRDEATVTSFASYWESWGRWDVSIISDDASVLLSARTALPILRGVMDYSSKTITADNWGEMVGETHKARANTLILNNEQATPDAIRYFQARFQTVWVDERNNKNFDSANVICHGAYGVIVNDVESTFTYLDAFKNLPYTKQILNRPVFNVAHRGLPGTEYENSLEGCQKAYESGATHIEIDIQVTKDNKLAIMHDDTIDRTTTGTGSISDYTAEELKQFKIDSTLSGTKKGDGVAIPMLDDIFNAFKGTDLVIVVEIKTGNVNCPQLLEDYIKASDIADQVVCISFYAAQLRKMRDVAPEIPCADLNTYNQASMESTALKTLNEGNFVIDSNTAGYTSQFSRTCAERGYALWMWTYETVADAYTGIKNGIVGVTNNVADELVNIPTGLVVDGEVTGSTIEEVTAIGHIKDYQDNLETKDITCTPAFYEQVSEKVYRVIFAGKFDTGTGSPRLQCTVFSEPMTVTLKDNTPTPEENSSEAPAETSSEAPATTSESSSEGGSDTKKKGCGGSIAAVSSILVVASIALGIASIGKKKAE